MWGMDSVLNTKDSFAHSIAHAVYYNTLVNIIIFRTKVYEKKLCSIKLFHFLRRVLRFRHFRRHTLIAIRFCKKHISTKYI